MSSDLPVPRPTGVRAPVPTVAATVYPTQDAAFARAERLRAVGLWPGTRRSAGGWVLTFDPAGAASRLDSHGYEP